MGEVKCVWMKRFDIESQSEKIGRKKCLWRCVVKRIDEFVVYDQDWVEDTRVYLSLVATVIATMAFQAVLNPPGSFIQQRDGQEPLACYSSSGPCPGQPMIAYLNPAKFRFFLGYSVTSFISSMIVVLVFVSGLSLKNKYVLRLLCAGMILSVGSLIIAYSFAIIIIYPSSKTVRAAVAWTKFMFVPFVVAIFAIPLLAAYLNQDKKELTKPHKASDQGEGTRDTSANDNA